jgi:hypothetical protein
LLVLWNLKIHLQNMSLGLEACVTVQNTFQRFPSSQRIISGKIRTLVGFRYHRDDMEVSEGIGAHKGSAQPAG